MNSTFSQALDLYKQGRTDEVVAGCNLILQMDPLFDPAKRLLEKAKNPLSPVDIDSLTAGASATPALVDARAAMAARDFERVIQLTTEILTNDLMNDDARVLADEAREKVEASPFIEQFVRKCEQSINNNNLAAARMDLEKARALDASHPGVRRIEQMIAAKEKATPAASSSSFVVEPPAPAAGRSTAQASDFGFTFEEEKPGAKQSFANFAFDSPATPSADKPLGGGFSFDTPVANPTSTPSMSFDTPAKAPSNEFDFSTASIETSPDDQKKIAQYLADGDNAFDSGNFQQAIDLWSRIFLIDVTNDAASDRIERAKSRRREGEQKIEGILAAGVQAFERRDVATARAKLGEVLQLDPNNVTAQDYMERLESPTGAAPAFQPPAEETYADNSVLEDAAGSDAFAEPGEDQQGPTPRRGTRAPASRSAAASTGSKPMGLIITVIVAVVVIAAGYFAYSKFMATPKVDPAGARALLDRATTFSAEGKYDQAIATLQDIKPGDTQYDKALVMIADLQQKKARASAVVEGRPAGSYFDENVAAGRLAFQSHDYVSAKKAFEQAMRVKPLPIDVKAPYELASQQVAKLEGARTLFTERKYQDVITSLQPLMLQDPQNKNIQRMIIDSHFNLGAAALYDERLPDARREFEEVLKSDPNDEL
ncbi:MAG TPA: hypothetical protein VF505_00315, partial [Thermoanaerobaculia bacterium]